MSWIGRFTNLFRSGKLNAEVGEELQFHIEARVRDAIAAGMTPAEARQEALRRFGGQMLAKERSREANILVWLETTGHDIRYAFRSLARNRSFTAVAVLSLALGIGANTAIFGLLDVILLRTLPVRNPQELRIVSMRAPGERPFAAQTYPFYALMRDRNRSFQELAGAGGLTWKDKSVGSDNAWHEGQQVSGNYFSVLGVDAALGRTIAPADDSIESVGGPQGAVAMLSYSYWRRGFHRDPAVLGRQINVNGAWLTIVGVTAPEFFGTRVGRCLAS